MIFQWIGALRHYPFSVQQKYHSVSLNTILTIYNCSNYLV